MLALTRRPLETIHIGSDIRVTVVEVRGNAVRLAIDAPKEIPIIRAELIPRLRLATQARRPD